MGEIIAESTTCSIFHPLSSISQSLLTSMCDKNRFVENKSITVRSHSSSCFCLFDWKITDRILMIDFHHWFRICSSMMKHRPNRCSDQTDTNNCSLIWCAEREREGRCSSVLSVDCFHHYQGCVIQVRHGAIIHQSWRHEKCVENKLLSEEIVLLGEVCACSKLSSWRYHALQKVS